MPVTSSDDFIIEQAIKESRVIVTQDLGFSRIIALASETCPSLITLRLISSRIEFVNERLESSLPVIEPLISKGIIAIIEDNRVRIRNLPV